MNLKLINTYWDGTFRYNVYYLSLFFSLVLFSLGLISCYLHIKTEWIYAFFIGMFFFQVSALTSFLFDRNIRIKTFSDEVVNQASSIIFDKMELLDKKRKDYLKSSFLLHLATYISLIWLVSLLNLLNTLLALIIYGVPFLLFSAFYFLKNKVASDKKTSMFSIDLIAFCFFGYLAPYFSFIILLLHHSKDKFSLDTVDLTI